MDLSSLPVAPPRAHERPNDGLPFPPDATIKTMPIAVPTAPRHPGCTQLAQGSRIAVLHDLLPSVHQVPFKFFEKNIFPRIPQNIKPSAVLKRLERQRHIRDGRWSAFSSDPHTYLSRTSSCSANYNDELEKENENKVFGRLHEVVTAIQECVTAQKRTTTEYMSAPDSTPVCSFDEKAGRPDEIPRYDIKVRVPVKSKRTTLKSAVTQVLTYRTTRLINDDGARSFRGSGTRVWEVVPVVNGVEKSKDIHVLKDNWVDDDRQHEGDILKEIMENSSLDKLARKELAALFLTPIAQGDVYITDERDGQEKLDSTRGLATRKACIPADATAFSLIISESYTSFHGARRCDSVNGREAKISGGKYENAEQAEDGTMIYPNAPHA